MLEIKESIEIVESVEVNFTCVCCKQTELTEAIQFKTTGKLLLFVTIPWVTREVSLKCVHCNATHRTVSKIEDLSRLSTDQLSSRFKIRIGFIEKFLVISGWLLFFTGPIGLALFVGARITIPLAAVGWRRATFAGLIITGITTALGCIAMVIGALS